MNTLEKIIEHGLSVRQIPEQVIEHWTFTKVKPGDVIVEREWDTDRNTFAYKEKMALKYPANYRIDYESKKVFRRIKKSIRYPKHGGKWMSQRTTDNTDACIKWDVKRHNLAPTLQESVSKCLGE